MSFLFFDFDGVIVDTLDISYESSKKASGGSYSREEYLVRFHGNIYEYHKSKEDASDSKKEVPTAKDDFFRHYIPRLFDRQPIDGMRQILAELAATHTLAIVSSTINAPIQEYLDRYEIAQYFDTVFGADTHTSKVKKINMLLELYATTPEHCLFITDTLGDMREATKADVKSIGVAWGFHAVETLHQGSPIAIAKSPDELAHLIAGYSV